MTQLSPSGKVIYAYFDGDDVGPQLELRLLDNKIEEARAYSLAVSAALERVKELLEAAGINDIIACGGDDLIASWLHGRISIAMINEITADFYRLSGRTMSVGIGRSTREAAQNLHRAKLMGKNQVICSSEVAEC
ncbi:mCpol domain-containing protein [Streptosporangium sp. NPDC000563]|uniref:mCpol domain-containing protein n=1 Tax=Streptosporangium sp. NPDC000563 TaxID=3154366 RepID=UPI00332FA312